MDLSGSAPEVVLSNTALTLSGLALKLQGADAPFLELPDARVSGVRFDLSKRDVEVGKIAVKGGHARVVVDESGRLNMQRVAKESAIPAASGKPWNVKLKDFDLGGVGLDYRDTSRTPGLKAGIGAIRVGLKAEAEAGADQPKALVSDIAVRVSDVQAGFLDSSEQPARIEKFAIEGGGYNLAANALTLEKVSIDGGALDVRRLTDGALNLALLFARPQEGPIAKEPEEEVARNRAFQFLSKIVSISGLKGSFSDLSARSDGPILNLEDVNVVLNDVDGKSPMTFDVGLKVVEGG